MSVVYGITVFFALALIVTCMIIDKQKDRRFLLLFVCVFLCNLGYFLLSLSTTLPVALMAYRLTYLGSVFLPYFLMMMILNLCRLSYIKWLPSLLIIVGIFMFLIAASAGILPIYYSSVSLQIIDGVSLLVREYGPLHVVYSVYLISYFFAMLIIIAHAIHRKKLVSTFHAVFLLCAVLCNLAIWLAERFLPRGFEFLSVSYILSGIFILLLYGILQEYDLLNRPPVTPSAADNSELFTAVQISRICTSAEIAATLTPRERDVLECLLANDRRADIAEKLFVSESAIKKYTSAIFKKLSATNRIELFAQCKKYL